MSRCEKKKLYYSKAISLYRDKGMGAHSISKVLPVSVRMVQLWINDFKSGTFHYADESLHDKYYEKVISLFNSGKTRKEISQAIPVKVGTVNLWLRKHLQSHPEDRRKSNKELYFDRALKLYQEGVGAKKITEIIPVPLSTIKNWFRIFASSNKAQTVETKSDAAKADMEEMKDKTPKDIKSLSEEIERLKKQLSEETLRADAYDEMINIAEKKFNIQIRKKVGAKR